MRGRGHAVGARRRLRLLLSSAAMVVAVVASSIQTPPTATAAYVEPRSQTGRWCAHNPPTRDIAKGPVLSGRQSWEFGAYSKCQAQFVAEKAREFGAADYDDRFGVPYRKQDGWYVLAPWYAW